MSSALDMSLDDLIKSNKKASGRGSRARGPGSGAGPTRRDPNRAGNRAAPYSTGKAAGSGAWYGVYSDQVAAAYPAPAAARAVSIETGTKLYISNLDYAVSNDDIKELFGEVGDIKRYSVHYDRSGRSKGTAEVVFSRKEHALAAVKRYNNVQLDGKPMKIEIVGTNIEKPAVLPVVPVGGFNNPSGIPKSGQARGGFAGLPRGGGRGQRSGRGRGRGDRGIPKSAAELDAELEKYHSEAMQIN